MKDINNGLVQAGILMVFFLMVFLLALGALQFVKEEQAIEDGKAHLHPVTGEVIWHKDANEEEK